MRSHTRRTAVLLALWVAGFGMGVGGSGLEADEGPRPITIAAKRFEFSPKEISIKPNETVKLLLSTEDVAHGFFVKPLGIDEDILPGKTTEVLVTPRKAGRYTTICDHFCGAGHGSMKMTIIVEDTAPTPGAGH